MALQTATGVEKKRLMNEIRGKEQEKQGKRMKAMRAASVKLEPGTLVQIHIRAGVTHMPKGKHRPMLGCILKQYDETGKVEIATPEGIIAEGRGGINSSRLRFDSHEYAVLEDNVALDPSFSKLMEQIRAGSYKDWEKPKKSINKIHEEQNGFKPFTRMNKCTCSTSRGCTKSCSCFKRSVCCHTGCSCFKNGLPCPTKNSKTFEKDE